MKQTRKIRLGLFIYTPMLGGAEQYYKDLLYNINREQFEVTAFFEPWDEFIRFLDLAKAPNTTVCPVRIREAGGHYGAKELTDNSIPKQLRSWEKILLKLIAKQKQLKHPLCKIPGKIVRAVIEFWLLFYNSYRLFIAFRNYPVDILHVVNGGYPGAQSAQLAGALARLSGCKISIMTVCNTPVPYHFPKLLDRFLDVLVRRYFKAIIVSGSTISNLLISLRNFSASSLQLIPYGVAGPEYYSISPAPFDVITSAQNLTVAASFLAHKGHRFFLEALAALRQDYPALSATLIGDGPMLANMQALVERLGINSSITFTGHCPLTEMLKIMSRSTIFVVPSEMEGMPLVILNAMSLGKPVVATSVGDISEVVLNEKTGLLVPAGDSEALTQVLRRLLGDWKRIQEMGAAGKKRFDENYTVEVMVKRHADLYQSL